MKCFCKDSFRSWLMTIGSGLLKRLDPLMVPGLMRQLQSLNEKKTEAGVNVTRESQIVPAMQLTTRNQQNDTNYSTPEADTPSSGSASEGFLGVGSDISFLRFPHQITLSDDS